jgi:hypothetical protein
LTANYDVHVFTVTPSIPSYPNIFTEIYHQDNSFTPVAEFLRGIPSQRQSKIYKLIRKLEEDEFVEGLYYYNPSLDTGGGTTTTFRTSRITKNKRVAQIPGLQFAWNRREKGSYVECRICCRKVKLTKLFDPANWKLHIEKCQARLCSPEKVGYRALLSFWFDLSLINRFMEFRKEKKAARSNQTTEWTRHRSKSERI